MVDFKKSEKFTIWLFVFIFILSIISGYFAYDIFNILKKLQLL